MSSAKARHAVFVEQTDRMEQYLRGLSRHMLAIEDKETCDIPDDEIKQRWKMFLYHSTQAYRDETLFAFVMAAIGRESLRELAEEIEANEFNEGKE